MRSYASCSNRPKRLLSLPAEPNHTKAGPRIRPFPRQAPDVSRFLGLNKNQAFSHMGGQFEGFTERDLMTIPTRSPHSGRTVCAEEGGAVPAPRTDEPFVGFLCAPTSVRSVRPRCGPALSSQGGPGLTVGEESLRANGTHDLVLSVSHRGVRRVSPSLLTWFFSVM